MGEERTGRNKKKKEGGGVSRQKEKEKSDGTEITGTYSITLPAPITTTRS